MTTARTTSSRGITPQVAARRLRAWGREHFEPEARGVLRAAGTRIAARAASAYMRDAAGDVGARSTLRYTRTGRVRRTGLRVPPRAATDAGPIRVVTGALRRALRPGGRGAVDRVQASGLRARLAKGVDLRLAPGGHNEGRRARSGADLSFMAPALADERGAIAALAERRFSAALRRALRGQPPARSGQTAGAP